MSEFQASNFIKENGGTPDLLGKTELTSPYFFVPPSGTTAERPQSCAAGTLRFNTDIGTLEVYRGDTIGWESIQRRDSQYLGGGTGSNTGTGTRIFCAGGNSGGGTQVNVIDFGTTSTLGNFQDFGDLSTQAGFVCDSRACSTTRGIIAGGGSPEINNIQFITVPSLGDSQDFGDLTYVNRQAGGFSNNVRGVFGGGYSPQPSTVDTVNYITIAQTGDAVDYGDLVNKGRGFASYASSTRGVLHCGRHSPDGSFGNAAITNVIQFTTIMTTGDFNDFGDATDERDFCAGGSNATRGIVTGGRAPDATNLIEFTTIATTGNAADFGDLTQAVDEHSASASALRAFSLGGTAQPATIVNIIEFVEITTLGNAKDFGDLSAVRSHAASFTNGHGGL